LGESKGRKKGEDMKKRSLGLIQGEKSWKTKPNTTHKRAVNQAKPTDAHKGQRRRTKGGEFLEGSEKEKTDQRQETLVGYKNKVSKKRTKNRRTGKETGHGNLGINRNSN